MNDRHNNAGIIIQSWYNIHHLTKHATSFSNTFLNFHSPHYHAYMPISNLEIESIERAFSKSSVFAGQEWWSPKRREKVVFKCICINLDVAWDSLPDIWIQIDVVPSNILITYGHSFSAGQGRPDPEGRVDVRDSGQALVFPWVSGELTIADPSSLAYSCLCGDGEIPRDLPCPLHPPPWWMGPGEWCSAFTLILSETTCLEPHRCSFAAAVLHITSRNRGNIL